MIIKCIICNTLILLECSILFLVSLYHYILYYISATKNNNFVLSNYKKYNNFSITSFTQENRTCNICAMLDEETRICLRYDTLMYSNFDIIYNNNDINNLFECHIFKNDVIDFKNMSIKIINEMQHNYTKSFYINKKRTECHENLDDLLKTVNSYYGGYFLPPLLIFFSMIIIISGTYIIYRTWISPPNEDE